MTWAIGDRFWANGILWQVTDIGSRVLVAVLEDGTGTAQFAGPPYESTEYVWDENDQKRIVKCNTPNVK